MAMMIDHARELRRGILGLLGLVLVVSYAIAQIDSTGGLAPQRPNEASKTAAPNKLGLENSPSIVKVLPPPGPDLRGTERTPIVVRIAPSEGGAEKAASEKRERDEKTRWDEPLVVFTGILALIGALQLIVFALQAKRLRETVEETRKSAELVAKQLRVSMRSSGPFLLAGSYKLVLYPESELPEGEVHRPKVGISFENLGKSVAIVRRMGVRLILTEGDSLPALPPALTDIPAVVRSDAIGPGHRGGEKIWTYETVINRDQARKLKLSRGDFLRFYVLGYVVYEDVFGGRLTQRFCLKIRQNGFQALRGPAEHNRLEYEAEPKGDPQGIAEEGAENA